MPIGQTHTKHRSIFKKLCKNIYSTNLENSNNSIYLLFAALWSELWYVTLQVVLGDLVWF